MIVPPRRSVTRFFIPLIDVLTLLFCIFLFMPIVKPAEEDQEMESASPGELERLLLEKKAAARQLQQIRAETVAALERRLAIRVLEIDEATGKLFFYDPARTAERRFEISAANVQELVKDERQKARGHELYFLFLYPRPAKGSPVFPLRRQKEAYERWFEGVAHGYEIPRYAP